MISGLVDTGADRSVLPIDYAEELGYTVDDLAPVEVGQVEGSASAWMAQKPCGAIVDGIPELEFEITPLFVASLNALWPEPGCGTARRVRSIGPTSTPAAAR